MILLLKNEIKPTDMKKIITLALLIWIIGCTHSEVEVLGKHYQQHGDVESLRKVVDLLPLGTDTAYIRQVLGEPIDMGFDFRYLVDSTGINGCAVGAVFHIGEGGKIDQKWLDEICE